MAKSYIVTCTAALGPPHTWRTLREGDVVEEGDFHTPGTFAKMLRKEHIRETQGSELSSFKEETTKRDREAVRLEGMSDQEADAEVAGRKAETKRAGAAAEEKRAAEKVAAEKKG